MKYFSILVGLIFSLQVYALTEAEDRASMDEVMSYYFSECMKDKSACKAFEEAKRGYKEKIGLEYQPPSHEKNYDPDSCQWAQDMPRRVVRGPGCSLEGEKICVGFVTCNQKVGAGKFTRMSTCSESNCGDDGAVRCTKETGYGSSLPNSDVSSLKKNTTNAVPSGVQQ